MGRYGLYIQIMRKKENFDGAAHADSYNSVKVLGCIFVMHVGNKLESLLTITALAVFSQREVRIISFLKLSARPNCGP